MIIPGPIFSTIQIQGVKHETDWVTLASADRAEVWVNVVAAQGIYKDNGGKSPSSVQYAMEIERLSEAMLPTGIVETVTSTLSGRDSDERAETLERVTAWKGPARVRMYRITPYDYAYQGVVSDEIKWADLYSVTQTNTPHFGNKTTIHTVTKATPRATAARTRQLNCLASRKLPIWDGAAFSGAFDATGRHVAGTIAATSRIMDIIPAVVIDPVIGARALADVDMVQIGGVQAALEAWHADAGRFNYTFDGRDTSLEEMLSTIANAAFCTAYRQGGKIRLALDRPQTASTALFTHRNKRPDSETITRSFANDSGYDGIELTYSDPASSQPETITLPLDRSATKYKRVEYPGIRSFAQAWLRANRDYNKLRGQRVAIETEVTGDGRLVLPGGRVDIVDNTRFKSFDGEVLGQSGLALRLSQRVEFAAGPHSILLKRRDGTVQSLGVIAGSHDREVVLLAAPSEAIVTQPTPDVGVRTEYSIASDSARHAQAWLIQEVSRSDGEYIKLTAINYTADYYAADHAAIPPRNSVIN